MVEETWCDIPGFSGYQASDAGRIRSTDRMLEDRLGRKRFKKGVMLRPAPSASGHLSVVLGRKVGTKSVHTLVLSTFVGPRPKGLDILHLNHNPGDNRVSNLKYGTRTENLNHDYATGARRRSFPVEVVFPCGKVIYFKNTTRASEALGLGQPAVSLSLKLGTRTRKKKVLIRRAETNEVI